MHYQASQECIHVKFQSCNVISKFYFEQTLFGFKFLVVKWKNKIRLSYLTKNVRENYHKKPGLFTFEAFLKRCRRLRTVVSCAKSLQNCFIFLALRSSQRFFGRFTVISRERTLKCYRVIIFN